MVTSVTGRSPPPVEPGAGQEVLPLAACLTCRRAVAAFVVALLLATAETAPGAPVPFLVAAQAADESRRSLEGPSAWAAFERSLGRPDAPVTLIAYLDPAEELSQELLYAHWDEFVRRYVDAGHVRLTYRPAPLLSDFSVALALAAACVGEQSSDGFWKYVRHWASPLLLYYHNLYVVPSGRQRAERALRDAAAKVAGTDLAAFDACYARLRRSRPQPRDLAAQSQISEVPTFVIGTERRSRLDWEGLTAWLNEAVQAARPPSPAPVVQTAGDWAGLEQTLGRAEAPVTLIAYVDFADPASLAFIKQHHAELVQRYIETGHVRLVYRPAPLREDLSVDLAVAAACLAEQSPQRFWAFYQHFNALDYRGLFDFFGRERTFQQFLTRPPINADASMFMTCYGRENHPARRAQQLAVREGVTQTPAFVVGDQRPSAVAWEELTARLEQAVKAAQAQPTAPVQAAEHPWAGLEQSLGSPSAPVTLVAYIDFFDARSLAFIEQYHDMLERRYINPGSVRFVYRPAPLADVASAILAYAAACAAQQGPEHFWWFYRMTVSGRQTLEEASSDFDRSIARAVLANRDHLRSLVQRRFPSFNGRPFDPDAYEDCLDLYEKDGREAMRRARELATREGIVQTPTLVIGSERRSGVPRRPDLTSWLEAHLRAAGASRP